MVGYSFFEYANLQGWLANPYSGRRVSLIPTEPACSVYYNYTEKILQFMGNKAHNLE